MSPKRIESNTQYIERDWGQGRSRKTTEVRLTRQAGAQFYARLEGLTAHDPEGRLLQYKLTVSDISERVRAEEVLRESERLTHSALDALAANICILDETGTILVVNQAWRDFAEANQANGHTRDYAGLNYLAICEATTGPDAVEALAFAAGIRSIIKGERDRFELEYPCHSLSEQRWFVGRVTRFKGQGPIRVVVAHSNITERKRAEEILLKASRMEATATLAGGIAHDVNNLMTTVLGNAELLILNLNQPDAPGMLAAISRSARRAGELAQQMLAFARGGKYQPRRMNLNDAIQQALQLHQDVIPYKLIVQRQFAPDLWSVAADASQMSQVLVNLLTNAVEASDGKGRIRVSTANLVIDEPWSRSHPAEGIRNLKPGKYVNVVVDDTGQGMNAEVLAKVFEPFFTTKFQGRGMGLAAVYGIVQNHGGDISIESEAGHGTVVKMYLPAVEWEL